MGKCQWGCSVFPSLPRRILKCFAAVRSKGGCTSVSIAALRSSLPLAAVVGFRQRGTLSNQHCDRQGEQHRGREQVHRWKPFRKAVKITGLCVFYQCSYIWNGHVAEVWSLPQLTVTKAFLVLQTPGCWLRTDHDEIGEELGRAVILFTHQVVCRVGLHILFYVKSVL